MSQFLQQLGQMGIKSDTYLSNVYEIEDILLVIHNLHNKIQHLKGLKDHRMKTLSEKITDYEKRVDQLRELVLNTVKHHAPDTKKFEFPEVGNVIRRVSKGSWDIEDDEAVIEFMTQKGMANEILAPVKPKLDRKKAKEVISGFQDQGIKVPGSIYKDASESISISFDEKIGTKISSTEDDIIDQVFPAIVDVKKLSDLEV